MTTVTLRATGTAPPEQMWERYADTRRWPDWSPQIRSVDTRGGARITPGLAGTVHPVVGPAVRFTIEGVDEDEMTWSWTVRLGPLRLRLVHGVEDGGTWLRVTGPLPVIAGYAPAAWLALRRLVRP